MQTQRQRLAVAIDLDDYNAFSERAKTNVRSFSDEIRLALKRDLKKPVHGSFGGSDLEDQRSVRSRRKASQL